MKVIDAIKEANVLKPNMYGTEVMIKWLDRLDRRIFSEVWLTHVLSDEEMAPYLPEDTEPETTDPEEPIIVPPQEDGTAGGWLPAPAAMARDALDLYDWHREKQAVLEFKGYTEADTETELLVGSPYDELYIHWLEAQIDWYNREIEGFNASNMMFESVYQQYKNAFNRDHMPLGRRKVYF